MQDFNKEIGNVWAKKLRETFKNVCNWNSLEEDNFIVNLDWLRFGGPFPLSASKPERAIEKKKRLSNQQKRKTTTIGIRLRLIDIR
jgi:hypothetical protein